jgi:signal transduction histidine kinase
MRLSPLFHRALNTWRAAIAAVARDRIQQRIFVAAGVIAILLVLLITRNIRDASQLLAGQAASEQAGQQQALVINLRESLNLADYTARSVRRHWLQSRNLHPQAEYTEHFPNFRDLILQIAIIGPDGWLQASSLPLGPEPVYLGDRPHFKAHQNTQQDGIFISQLLTGRVSGQASVQYTRPILDAGGRFAGVVVLSLDAEYLRRVVFDSVLNRGELALLLNDDGRLVLAHRNGALPGADDPLRSQASFNPADFPDHNWLKASIEGYPLRLVIGTANDSIDQQLQHIRFFGWALAALLLLGLLLYLRNITHLVRERNALMQHLEDARRKAERASQMKSRFVSSVSHELRTPLNGILGFAQLVEMSDSLDEAHRNGHVIHKSAQHLNNLVNTILDLSKIEAGQLELHLQRVPVRDLVQTAFTIHQMSATQKGLNAQLVLAPDLPEHIHTDPTRLTQVLNNLLHNAVKFTPKGRIRCKVTYGRGHWDIAVHDTGTGMAPEQIAHIFKRFNNIHMDSELGHAQQGAGLGMALTYELVSLMGGRISVVSRKGHGTAVRVKLPDEPPAATPTTLA